MSKKCFLFLFIFNVFLVNVVANSTSFSLGVEQGDVFFYQYSINYSLIEENEEIYYFIEGYFPSLLYFPESFLIKLEIVEIFELAFYWIIITEVYYENTFLELMNFTCFSDLEYMVSEINTGGQFSLQFLPIDVDNYLLQLNQSLLDFVYNKEDNSIIQVITSGIYSFNHHFCFNEQGVLVEMQIMVEQEVVFSKILVNEINGGYILLMFLLFYIVAVVIVSKKSTNKKRKIYKLFKRLD